MPGFQLLADFDRSRRIENSAAERAARGVDPGAIVAANLDRDDRPLPDRPAAGAEIALDGALPSKPALDDDPAPLILAADRGAGQHHLSLSITSRFMRGIRLLDGRKRALYPAVGTFGRYDLGAHAGPVELFVEVETLAGSPLRGFPTLSPGRVNLHRFPPPPDERRFSIAMRARPLAGGAEELQQGVFTIAPWIMVPESAPLLRLYIVATADNHPTVADLQRALPDPAKLVLVPDALTGGDTWIQDQFELGCFHTPHGVALALLHMPRLRQNYTGRGVSSALPNFVRAHFPSRRAGVYDEFWRRTLPVEDTAGRRVDIAFDVSGMVREALLRPFVFRSHLLVIAHAVLTRNPLAPPGGAAAPPAAHITLPQALQEIAAWAPPVLRQLEADIAAAADPARRALLEAHRSDLIARRRLVDQAVSVGAGGIQVTATEPPPAGQTQGRVVWSAAITADTAERLEARLSQMHASQNYGGNLQLGPPTPAAPYGRIFIGNDIYGREGLVDPELLNFLDQQRVQPLVQIDTSWLAVAHVDEILAFVPRRRGPGDHAVWLNSPKLALDILRAARRQYIAGLPQADLYFDRPMLLMKRELDEGTSPVTALFRGKHWHHAHRPGSTDIQEPPQLYIAMAEFYQSAAYTIHHTPWRPGPGPDRDYPARMTIRELLYFESAFTLPDPEAGEAGERLTTNELIEQEKLGYLRAQLEALYPGIAVVPVPTIYDIVRQPTASTGAYTPNAANLVVADGRLLIPKPFGPRVRPVDAVAILGAAFRENHLDDLLSGLSERWIRDPRNGLLGVRQWFRRQELDVLPGADDLSRLAEEFKDGLTGVSPEERRRRIENHNRGLFRRGDLRPGWHEIAIPEDTVDLFEAAIALAARHLGLGWRFVDSWSYHLTFGEIHCGTNALRTPSFAGVSPWWEFFFRPPGGSGGASP